MDTKLTEWKVEDYVGTPEDRAMFIEAAIEEAIVENDPGIFADALVAIAKALSKTNGEASERVVSVMMAVSSGIDMTQAILGKTKFSERRMATA